MPSDAGTLIERLRRKASSLGLALVVLSPLVFVRALEDAFVLPQRLMALAGLALAFWGLGRASLNRSTLFLAGLAYLGWRALCQSLGAGVGESWPWVVAQMASVGALFLAAHAGRDAAWARRAWRWAGLSVLLVSGYALYLLWGGDAREAAAVDLGFLQRAHGSLGNPDFLAGFLVIALPALALAALRPGSWALLRLAALGLAALALWLTQVRAAWLGGAVSLGLVLVVAWRSLSAPRLIVAAILGLSLLAVGPSPWQRLSGSFKGDGSWAGRRFMGRVALEVAKAHPLLGVGAGRFQEAYLTAQGHLLSRSENGAEPYRFTADIHDDWLQIAAESGVVGLLLFIALFTLALRAAWARRTGIGTACLGLFVAFGVQAAFHFPLNIQASSLFFWGAVGLLAAEEDRGGPGPSFPWSWVAVPLVLGLVLTAQQVVASAALNSGSTLMERGQAPLAAAFFRRATELWPQDERAWMRWGRVQDAQGDVEAAVSSFAKATHASPGLPEAWANLALTLGKSGDLPSAQAAAQEALVLNPRAPEAWANLAKIRSLQGDQEGAQRDLEGGLAQAGPSPLLYFNLGAVQWDRGQRAAAKDSFDACLRLQPGNAEAAHWAKVLAHAR